ncbi:zinc transporter ZIP9-like isoform X2 [Patiria miniata]|uniref:Zinc transporter ZIP9 n=1 Tax=Patiria miniata TaxID=46514 RepID=A0A914BS42_PATMI|nr:zinc transporter ZIP9-like isoform X2 [Patiria miniata]
MEDAWGILALSFAMLIGCYIAGTIPLTVPLSESKMRFVTVLGAGLLVGTALAVIIPEGVHTLFAGTTQESHVHVVNPPAVGAENQAGGQPADGNPHEANGEAHAHTHSTHNEAELHYVIGVSLVLGFVFMLLVDQIGGAHGHSHAQITSEGENASRTTRIGFTATLGLVVHAAADGVAMGAAAMGRTDVQMIVFIAIMLHKAPAAFGLVTFLLHENYQRNRIRRHLVVFSMAAPVAALVTYFGLSHASKEALSTFNATGISMLFSAGTFLYVATVHVLPEIAGLRRVSSDVEGSTEMTSGFSRLELLAVVSGCLAPLVLSLGHHH